MVKEKYVFSYFANSYFCLFCIGSHEKTLKMHFYCICFSETTENLNWPHKNTKLIYVNKWNITKLLYIIISRVFLLFFLMLLIKNNFISKNEKLAKNIFSELLNFYSVERESLSTTKLNQSIKIVFA